MRQIIHALKPSRFFVFALLAILGSLVALGVQDPPDASAYALWIDVECTDHKVTEGHTFRLHVVTEQPPHLNASTIKVRWTTVADTADETDYRPLHREGQASNRYQSNTARMGRTFHTINDSFSELDEHFNVKAVNASSDSRAAGQGNCRIKIEDDDGPGAMKTWIDSEPSDRKYTRGDTIRIKQQFTEAVAIQDGQVNLGLLFGQDPEVATRNAHYVSGTGTDTLTFEYTVTGDDLDIDGIEIPNGDYGGSGSIVTLEDRSTVNTTYRGLPASSEHIVDGKTTMQEVSIISSPADGTTYRFGEDLEVQMRFSRAVQVDGDVQIDLRIGDDYRGAAYDRGSGSDTLVFSYTVRSEDLDADGFSVSHGYILASGDSHGFAGDGSITDVGGDFTVNPFYSGLADQSDHEVDGRPYVTSIAVTSNPTNGTHYRMDDRIMVSLTFDRAVSVQPKPGFNVKIGDREVLAQFYDGSLTDTLVFSYKVDEDDVDTNGISVPALQTFTDSGGIWEARTRVAVNPRIPPLADQPGQGVKGTLPTVISNEIVSAPSHPPYYRYGDDIEIALVFDEPVTTLGAPWISINLDGLDSHERNATYQRGAGTDTLVFAYTVQDTDIDHTGVALPAGEPEGFTGNVRVYQAGTENQAKGYIPGFADAPEHRVAGRPHITSIEVSSDPGEDGVYEMSDTIELLVNFVDQVTVTGSPQLTLDLNGATQTAAYREARRMTDSEGAANTGEALVFAYTVQTADEAADGISVLRDALDLNSGSIVDLRGHQPGLTNDPVTFAGHPVIEVAPVLESVRTSQDGSQVILTFSENVQLEPSLHTLSAFAGIDVSVYLRALIDVYVDGHRAHTHGAVISGKELTLAMDSEITQGQSVEIAYDDVFARDVPGVIVDHADNPLAHFSNQSVTNASTQPADADANWPVISAYSLTIPEGRNGTYTVALGIQPSADVTVSLSIAPATHLTSSHQTLTFTTDNWSTPQTVTLTAGTDDDSFNFWQEIVHTADVDSFMTGHLKVLVQD